MHENFKLLVIVGMPGAGKTTAAKLLQKKGVSVLRFGDVTDEELRKLGKEINPTNERWFREKLRREMGQDAYAVKIEPQIIEAATTNSFVVVEGMRSWEEYLYLKQRFPWLKVLHIYASPKIRYQRLQSRRVRPLSESEAHERDVSEIEKLNAGGSIAIADYLIRNEGSLKHLQTELEKIYKSL